MIFAHRKHSAFVNLSPGESMRFRLPPMTEGVVIINGKRITIGPVDQPGDHSGGASPPPPAENAVVDFDAIAGVELVGAGGDQPSPPSEQPAIDFVSLANIDAELLGSGGQSGTDSGISFAKKQPTGAFGSNILDPGEPGGTAPAPEIMFELMSGEKILQEKTGKPILHEMPGASEFWSLRVTRKPDGFDDRRRYRIDAEYPGVLPLIDRRIPVSFLQQGFDLNWNNSNYLEMLRIENKVIQYRWNEQLAALYGLERETTLSIGIDEAEFPVILATNVELRVGFSELAPIPPATAGSKTPFIALHIDLECVGSRVIDIDGPDNITLPKFFFVEVRLELGCLGGIMIYSPRIVTSLDLEDHILWKKVDFEKRIRGKEQTLVDKQWGDGGRNFFDEIFRPWFVGHYEVTAVEFDEPAGDIVISHVGKPVMNQVEVSAEAGVGFMFGAMPKLFSDAEDERVLPAAPFDPSLPLPATASPGNLAKVDHIIVLMQENRSFDQVLGYLSRDGLAGLGVQDHVEGLLAGDNLRDVNEVRLNPISAPEKFRSTRSTDTSWPFPLSNPCHGRDCVQAQMTGGMKSFVANYAARLGTSANSENLQRIMNYHAADELKVFAALARDFAICDHWFGSHIGGTLPNRHVTFSGDLNRDRQDLPEEDNSNFRSYAPSERLTFFDHLTARGIEWKLFEHGYSFLRLYRNFTFETGRIVGFEDPLLGFERAALDGNLPAVTFIEPDYIEAPDGNDDHAPADMQNGQRLVARIVRALVRGGQWKKSMLIITYDEHGGFYDHVIPPKTIETIAADGTVSSRPIPPLSNTVSQLGPRVPAIIVSPLIPRGEGKVKLSDKVYEHASIPATILRRFCSPRPPFMSARVDGAADLGELLTLDEARPDSDFTNLLQILDVEADRPTIQTADAVPVPVPMRKLPATADAEDLKEDFQGFIAYASSITGRGD